jgi:hypothetical protein
MAVLKNGSDAGSVGEGKYWKLQATATLNK